MVKTELKRAFLDKKTWIMLIIGVGIVISYFFMYTIGSIEKNNFLNACKTNMLNGCKTYMITVDSLYDSWFGNGIGSLQAYLYYMILPLLVAGSYADSFFVEKKSGYLKNVFIRESKKSYFLDKLVAVFLVAGFVFIIPMVINLLMTSTVLPVHRLWLVVIYQ